MSQKKQVRTNSLWLSLSGIFCACFLIGIFLITAIEAVAYWIPDYYEREYTKYSVLDDLPEMSMEDLLIVTDEMMSYLRGEREDLHVFTTMGGEYQEFFNAREIAHMEDVRDLFIGGLWLRRICLFAVIGWTLFLSIWSRHHEERIQLLKEKLPTSLCVGTALFLGTVLVLAGIISTDFTKYFFIFHYIFFDNDLWLLDPATDMLINIVPEPFFMDTALYIGLLFAAMLLAFLGICLFFRYRYKTSILNGAKTAKLLGIALCAVLTISSPMSAYASVSWPSNVSIAADGGILMDARSGTILYEKNMNEAYYPASITKVLTAWIIIKHCNMDDMVTFTHSAVNTLEPGASILGARVGDKMSVRDCLYALLLQSANEVANALAEHCSGSVEAFAELMNQEAKALGCTNSNFANPSGLNDENHYTTAHDMALIAQAAFSDPAFVTIDSTLYYDVPAGQLKQYPDGWRYYAHHRMLKKNDSLYYNGIIGGKTGYTSLAGNTLITCAERNGIKLITVVLNGHQTHYSDTKTMLDFGFDNFQSVSIAQTDSIGQQIEQDLTIGDISPGTLTKLSLDEDSAIILPIEGDFSDVTSSIDYALSEDAPDHAIARIDYLFGNRIVGQAYLQVSTEPGYTPPSVSVTNESGNPAEPILQPEHTPIQSSAVSETEIADVPSKEPSRILSIIIIVLCALLVIGTIGGSVFGIILYRKHKEEQERMIRYQRREQRLKNWGYSTVEFDQIMHEHLRSKNQPKKRGFFEHFKH